MPSTRRQLSLFLPEPERVLVDAVRSAVDPRQHALIPAHVTLCREDEIDDGDMPWRRLVALGRVRVALALGGPTRLADGCVLLPVSGSTKSFHALRAVLLGRAARAATPHVTLLHPRNAAGSDDVLDEIRRRALPNALVLEEVSLIEQRDGGAWRVLSTHAPGNGAQRPIA